MLYNLRKSVLEANLELPKHGLVIFTWGNVSGIDRSTGLVAIKPSGVEYEDLKVDDIVVVDMSGKVLFGNLKPSSDTPSHLHLYNNFPEITSIVHTRSPWASIWAQSGREIPVYGTTHADYFHGEIPCTRPLTAEEVETDYELNNGIVITETFKELDHISIPGVLVQGHGPYAWGTSVPEALHNAVVLEQVAMMAYYTEAMGQKRPIDQTLIDKHYLRKHGACAYYGQKKKRL